MIGTSAVIHSIYFLILVFSAGVFSFLATALALFVLKRTQVLDMPNERSNHEIPTPRGGGVATTIILIAFLLASGASGTLAYGLAMLGIISFIDDRKGLPAHWRLIAQFAAVLMCVTQIDGSISQGLLPDWLDAGLMIVIWVWMINLTNFMDGIDGITGAEAIAIGAGLVLVQLLVPHVPRGLLIDGALTAAVMAGFLFWNWHRAKLFLGDVGSVPLGFLLGFLLLQLAASGHWAAALILPAYYLTDATITLLRRLITGQKIWEAHSEHFYQQAVRKGFPHDDVVQRISVINVMLIIAAIITGFALPQLGALKDIILVAIAYALSFCLCLYFAAGVPDGHFARRKEKTSVVPLDY